MGVLMARLKGVDILTGKQFTRESLDQILYVARSMDEALRADRSLQQLDGYVVASLFFEPSTRTRLSFETAMHRLGGAVVGFAEAGTSSVAKGESLKDTIRTVGQYVDVIVMRHPEIGSARQAAEVATVPVINGGDGAGQHPTQALLDLYTIQQERGQIDGTTIALCGDLKNGRTVHAGVELYRNYDCRLIFVAPEQLAMPPAVTEGLLERGVTVEQTAELEPALAQADVVYMTRIQKERFADPAEYERLKGSYVLNRDMVERINPDITIMHPLPRVNEISSGVDGLAGAAYFRQARNGIPVRMALLAMVLGQA
jgi:aspartate carbamoyltransferase catalytic subunit